MADSENDVLRLATERFERRLAEENGKVRVEMATEFGKLRFAMATEFGKVRTEMAAESGALRGQIAADIGGLRATMEAGFGALRAEMIDRNTATLRWLLIFGVSQTAALVGVLQLWK